jgi:hypothetical protein
LKIFFVNVELRYFFFLILSSDNNFIQYKTLFIFIFFLWSYFSLMTQVMSFAG